MSLKNYENYGKLIDKISNAIKNESISHAYIIEGDRYIDKGKFALEFSKGVLCLEKPGFGCDRCAICQKVDHGNYEDLYFIRADELSLKDAKVAQLQEKLKKRPIGGERNIAIIEDADTMTVRAQNRLLKTLEEPSQGTIIILLSENTDNLLPTIRSRSVIYRLNNYANDDDMENEGFPKELMEMIGEGTYFSDLKQKLDKEIKDRKGAFLFLDGLERLFRQYLTSSGASLIEKKKIISNVSYVEEARRDLLANVNYRYAIRNLILKIGG